jgi:hypothetical protein
MRNVIVSTYVTLDGVMEAPEKWTPQFWNEEHANYAHEQLFASDALLLGRFVTDGIESAIKQAKAAAGDKDVGVMGANTAQQCIQAGLLDEIQIHLVPVLLGGGVRLFDHLGTGPIELESTRVIESPVSHIFGSVS